jgi:hypothetical protein
VLEGYAVSAEFSGGMDLGGGTGGAFFGKVRSPVETDVRALHRVGECVFETQLSRQPGKG